MVDLPDFDIHVLTPTDPLSDVVELLCQSFSRNPFEVILGSTPDSMRPKFSKLVTQAAASGLSLVAIDTSTGLVAACNLNFDYVFTREQHRDGDAVAAVAAQLVPSEVDFAGLGARSLAGHIVHLAYGATRNDLTGTGITKLIMGRTLLHAAELGFKWAFLEGFHPVTVSSFLKVGARLLKEVDLTKFEFPPASGEKVFAPLAGNITPTSFLFPLRHITDPTASRL